MKRLTDALSAREVVVTEKMHTKNSVAEKERLKTVFSVLMEHTTELENQMEEEDATAVNLSVKIIVCNKKVDNIFHKSDGLQARL